ncbi:MAG: hypothetical protein Fur006_45400 [Coleofasciculaceae cyanobacterium]|jgi:hypothetical protein
MNSNDEINSLRRLYGQGIHLYTKAVSHRGWFLVPVNWDKDCYTIACLAPNGTYYIEWSHHRFHSLEEAIAAGREFIERQILELSLRPL